MGTALFAVLLSIRSFFRSQKALQAEVLALRYQVLVLRRQLGGRRIQLPEGDRILWACFRESGQARCGWESDFPEFRDISARGARGQLHGPTERQQKRCRPLG